MHIKLSYSIGLFLLLGIVLTGKASAEIVGWWRLDEGSGTVAKDSSRYKNDVFISGDPQWVAGYFMDALQFDGTDDYLDRGVYEPSLDITGELTITAWVKPGAITRDHKICGNITTGSDGGGYMMGIYSNNQVELEVRSSAGTSAQPNRPGGGTALQINTWYFLAATYSQTADGGVITTYVDGVFDRVEITTIAMAPSSGTFKIGRDPSAPGAGQFRGVIDDVRVYNHILTESEFSDAMLGKWPESEIAFAPNPEDEQVDVTRDVILGWTPGINALRHDVYFGKVFEDVSNADRNNPLNVLVKQDQDVSTYNPGLLDFGQTYFWRVDDINTIDSTINKGDIWSFTTETVLYQIPADKIIATASSSQDADSKPEKTIDGSGLVDDLHSNDTKTMWVSDISDPGSAWIQYDFDKLYKLQEMQVWNYNGSLILTGFGIRDATIEHSSDSTTWNVLPNVNEFEWAPGKKDYECNNFVDLNGITARSVRITANSNWGGAIFSQYGLSEVRFLYIPVHAREPNPESGATDVDIDVTLSWRAGREATEHDVYLDTDEQVVINSDVPVDTVSQAVYGPLSLDLAETYYWKINEVNIAEIPTTLEGEVWSFTTREYLVVDDFEDYNAGENQIWYSWHDGLGYGKPGVPPYFAGNGTGSAVGDETTGSYTEETIVHGGSQSMPLVYNNTVSATYSEAELSLESEDWTRAGIKTLVLYFHGTLGNTGQMYVKVNGYKVKYDGDAADIARPIWKQWNIDLVSFDVDLQNVTTLGIGIDNNGASGKLYFDDIRLYREAPSIPSETIWIEAEAGSITPPLQIFSAIPGASGGQYVEVESGNNSTDGPPAQGIASYNFTVGGGTYKISGRVIAPSGSNDSFYLNIPGAATQTVNRTNGWVTWNDIAGGSDWHWDVVHSSENDNTEVEWTMPAGTYTLNIAYREEGTLLDALVIVKVD